MNALKLVTIIKDLYDNIPKEVRDEVMDTLLDSIEKKDNKILNIVCGVVRNILDCPDDDVDNQNPI